MHPTMNKFFPFLLLLLTGSYLPGQVTLEREVVGSLGLTFTSPDLQLSATAGEAAVTTAAAPDILLTQGFHQAEPEDLTTVHVVTELIAGLSAYPNPAQSQFWVQVTSITSQRLTCEVLDLTGRRLSAFTQSMPAATPTTVQFNSSTWPAGIYLIRLLTPQGRLAGSLRVTTIGD